MFDNEKTITKRHVQRKKKKNKPSQGKTRSRGTVVVSLKWTVPYNHNDNVSKEGRRRMGVNEQTNNGNVVYVQYYSSTSSATLILFTRLSHLPSPFPCVSPSCSIPCLAFPRSILCVLDSNKYFPYLRTTPKKTP